MAYVCSSVVGLLVWFWVRGLVFLVVCCFWFEVVVGMLREFALLRVCCWIWLPVIVVLWWVGGLLRCWWVVGLRWGLTVGVWVYFLAGGSGAGDVSTFWYVAIVLVWVCWVVGLDLIWLCLWFNWSACVLCVVVYMVIWFVLRVVFNNDVGCWLCGLIVGLIRLFILFELCRRLGWLVLDRRCFGVGGGCCLWFCMFVVLLLCVLLVVGLLLRFVCICCF